MFKYFLRRLLEMIPKLIVLSVIIFTLLQFVPGDPISYQISPDQLMKMSPEAIDRMRDALGLNDPAPVRYLKWAKGILTGNFGYSLVSGTAITTLIAQRLPATVELLIFAFIIATTFGIIFGYVSAVKRNSPIDYTLTTLGMVGVSVPEFFFGLCAIVIFCFKLKLLPSGGRSPVGDTSFKARIPYMVMPVIILGLSYIAVLMRYCRSSMLDVMNKEYIKASRAKGLTDNQVNVKHVFRNALIPVMIIIVNRIPILISGAVVIESVFNYPGMGSLIIESIQSSDMPVVMICTLLIAAMVMIASFLVDIFSAMLDPRIRFGEN